FAGTAGGRRRATGCDWRRRHRGRGAQGQHPAPTGRIARTRCAQPIKQRNPIPMLPIIRSLFIRPLLVATSLTLLSPAAVLHAQSQTPPPASDMVTMNMRDADIRTLIQWIADQTGKNMVVHKDVQGKVNVLSAKPVTRAEAYRVFLSVLQVHGYAAIE